VLIVRPKSQKWLLITMISAGFFANTYLLAYFIVVPVGVLILVFWRRITYKALVLGVVFFSLLMGLYGVGIIQDWENTRFRTEAFFEGESRLTDEALSHAVRLVTGLEYAAARGVNAPADDADLRIDLSQLVHGIWLLALVLGGLLAIYALLRKSSRWDSALILLIWFIVPILAMSYSKRQVHPFYLMFTIPAGYGLAAWGISSLFEQLPALGKHSHLPKMALLVGVLGFTGGVNGLNSIRFAQETAAHPGEHLPYTLALREAIHIGNDIREVYQPNMLVYTQMDTWSPMVMAGEIFPVVENSVMNQMLVIPKSRALYTVLT